MTIEWEPSVGFQWVPWKHYRLKLWHVGRASTRGCYDRETDSMVLVSLIKEAQEMSSSVGAVINNCIALLQSIWGVKYVHVRCSANQVAIV